MNCMVQNYASDPGLPHLFGRRLPEGELTMQKRFTVCALTMLSISCGTALAAQLTPAQRIDRVITLLKSLETRDLRPLAYIGSSYTQHNLQVADGPAGVRELVLHPAAGTTVHTVRIFADGDYVVAQTDYNFGGPKVGFDVFRFDGDKIVEHWDNLQDKCDAPNPSGRTQLDGLYKIENGKQVEHWDVLETIPPTDQWKNPNGKF